VSTWRSCRRALRGPRAVRGLLPAFLAPVAVGVAGCPTERPGAAAVPVAAAGPAGYWLGLHGWLGAATGADVRAGGVRAGWVRAAGGAVVRAFAAGRPLAGIADVVGLEDFGTYPLADCGPWLWLLDAPPSTRGIDCVWSLTSTSSHVGRFWCVLSSRKPQPGCRTASGVAARSSRLVVAWVRRPGLVALCWAKACWPDASRCT